MLKGIYSTSYHPPEVLLKKPVFRVCRPVQAYLSGLSTVPPLSLPISDMYEESLRLSFPRFDRIS
jgi:hypothetical protein